MLAMFALLGISQAAELDLAVGASLVGPVPLLSVSPELRVQRFGASLELGGLLTPFGASGDAAAGVRYWALSSKAVQGWVGARAGTGGMAVMAVMPMSWSHADALVGVRVGPQGGTVAFDARAGLMLVQTDGWSDGERTSTLGPAPTFQLGVSLSPHRSLAEREARADARVRTDPVVEAVRAGAELSSVQARVEALEAERSEVERKLYGVDWDYLASMGGGQTVREEEAALQARLKETRQALKESRKVAKVLRREA
jgi:hypothetical protein